MAKRLPRNAAPQQPPAGIGDNSAAVEEADRIQLISIVSKLSAADEAIEVARAPLKAAQAQRKTIIGLGKAAGFTAHELEARLAEMKRPTREMAEVVQRESKHRRWLGITDAEQSELMLGEKVPQDDKDEAHWSGEGLKAGLRQLSNTAPTECPERFVQAYMKAHERGLIEVTAANAPKPKGMTAQQVAEQAARDFKADHPDLPEPGSPAAKKAERESVARATAALAKIQPVPEIVDEDPLGVNGPDDGFELSEEELAAQKPRAAIQDAAADEPVV